MSRADEADIETPFDATDDYEPRVVITETDPEALETAWLESREQYRVHRRMIGEQLDQLEAIERQMRAVHADRLDVRAKHWRRMLDDIDTFHAWEKQLNRACREVESSYMAFAEKLGMEGKPIPSKWLTVTIDEKMQPTYEPANWENIVVGLIGVDTMAVVDAIAKADASTLEAAIRSGLRLGNLDCIQRRLSEKKVEQLAMSSSGLPTGLSLTPKKIARKSRAVGTVPVDRE